MRRRFRRGQFGSGRFGPRWLGVGSLLAGLLVVVLVQSIAPIATPPLYDGVVPIDPYRWLNPPAGQPGGAKGASGTVEVHGSQSPLVAIATAEQPPQAQVFAIEKTLVMPHGTTKLKVTIEPVAVSGEPAPTDGHIAGNVYRILITDQAGGTVTALASGKVTVVLRGPDALADATIERVDGGAWRPLKTDSAGFASTFLAVVTDFGDFALIAPGPGPSASGVAAVSAAPSASAAPVSSGAGQSVVAPSTPSGSGSAASPGPSATPLGPTVSSPAAASSASAGSAPASGTPSNSGGSGPPILVIGAAVVAGLIGLAAFVLRGPRGGGTAPPSRPTYRGAHRDP